MTVLAYPARFARLVKFEHTVFALPFAYVGAFLAVNAVPSAHDLLWITLAMVGARSLAMGLNRLIDAGLAPIGAWAAITGSIPWEAWALGGAVALWVAGFDLFYSLLDVEIDRAQGLQSMATRFGERGVFVTARLFHASTVALLAAAGAGLDVGAFYWVGVAVVAVLLAYEHSLVRPGDLRRLDTAFFTMNGVISVAFCLFVLLDVL